jgi:hypothetical protein
MTKSLISFGFDGAEVALALGYQATDSISKLVSHVLSEWVPRNPIPWTKGVLEAICLIEQ